MKFAGSHSRFSRWHRPQRGCFSSHLWWLALQRVHPAWSVLVVYAGVSEVWLLHVPVLRRFPGFLTLCILFILGNQIARLYDLHLLTLLGSRGVLEKKGGRREEMRLQNY
jgi:hypothetical protein